MKKIIFILVAILLIFPSVSALTQINIYVDSTGNSLFLGQTDENPQLPAGIENSNGRITGVSSSLTSKNGEVWIFQYSLLGAEMNVILPEGAVIKSLSNGEVYLERGRIAVFVEENIVVSYSVEKNSTENNTFIVWIIILFVVIVLVIILVKYLSKGINKGRKKEIEENNFKQNKIEAVKSVLNEREKLILDKLKETGKTKTSYLRKECDIPKASFSRHLQELEKKGLVKKTGEGKNKFVELIE